MRIALVSPYSWTYPGGVTRHIEALAEQFLADRPRRRACSLPTTPPTDCPRACIAARGPSPRAVPDYLIPLGRTIGFKSNGAVSNLGRHRRTPSCTLRRELRAGGYDVVHVHEPVAPVVAWDAADSTRRRRSSAPSTATPRTRSPTGSANAHRRQARACNRLHVRIAVSEAAAWTGRRFFGGTLPRDPQRRRRSSAAGLRASAAPLRTRERAAADRLRRPGGRAQGPAGAAARLRGAARARPGRARRSSAPTQEEVAPLLLDGDQGVTVLGKLDDERKHAALRPRRRARARRRWAARASAWC